MSDLMLFGILRMPYDMAMGDDLSRVQFHAAAQRAADEIERLRELQKRDGDGLVLGDSLADLGNALAATAVDIAKRRSAEIADLRAELERLQREVNIQKSMWAECEAERAVLRAVLDSFPKLPGREWTADQVLIWLEQVHDWKKASQEKDVVF